MLIRTLGGVAHIIEQRSSFIIPLFISLFETKIRNGDVILSEPIADLSSPSPFFLNEQRRQILEFLDMLSKVKKPEKLHQSNVVKSILMHLLLNGDSIIQEKAFGCILTYRSPGILDMKDTLTGLLDDERFRDALSCINIDEFDNIKPESRPDFIAILCRILYGKAINRKGRGSAKAGLKARRSAIFAFISTLHHDYQQEFFGIMARPFETNQSTGPKTQIGFLTALESFFKQFKFRTLPFITRIMNILLNLLKAAEDHLRDTLEFEPKEDEDFGEDFDDHSSAWRTVRHLIMKRMVQVFRLDLDLDFSAFVNRLFSIYISSRIDKLSVENTQAPSVLLELFAAWASKRSYFMNLDVGALIPNLLDILSAKKVKDTVVSHVLSIIESLMALDEESKTEGMKGIAYSNSAIKCLLVPNIYSLLENLKHVLLKSSQDNNIRLNSSGSIPNRILHVISRLASYVSDVEQLTQIVDMMLPFLKKASTQVPEAIKMEILSILSDMLSSFKPSQEYSKYYLALAQLFSVLESRAARYLLVSTFKQLSAIDSDLEALSQLMSNLNAFSAKRLDEPDFDLRFAALRSISLNEHNLPPKQWLPVVHNLVYNIHDVEEYSVRTAAGNGLLQLVSLASEDTFDSKNSHLEIVIYTLLPCIKKGLKFNAELVRKEFLEVLSSIVVKLSSHPVVSDMTKLLAQGDDEANFFSNIYHPQVYQT